MGRNGEWGSVNTVWHASPTDDLIEHVTDSPECVCGPTVEAKKLDDGSVIWLATHHSLDGRERAPWQ